MVEFPKIPTRFHFSGDKVKAQKLVGLGKKRYADLVTALGFQGLKTGFNTLKFIDGTVIRTRQNFGISDVNIYIPVIGRGEEQGECKSKCLCGCGIQTGHVAGSPFSEWIPETDSVPGHWETAIWSGSWEYDAELLPQADDTYTIGVCKEPFEFRAISGEMRSLDFFPHGVAPDVFDKYFVVAEAYEEGVPNDLSLIDACTWDAFHLISLEYEDTIKRCT